LLSLIKAEFLHALKQQWLIAAAACDRFNLNQHFYLSKTLNGVHCSVQANGVSLKQVQVQKFKYLGVVCTSDER